MWHARIASHPPQPTHLVGRLDERLRQIHAHHLFEPTRRQLERGAAHRAPQVEGTARVHTVRGCGSQQLLRASRGEVSRQTEASSGPASGGRLTELALPGVVRESEGGRGGGWREGREDE